MATLRCVLLVGSAIFWANQVFAVKDTVTKRNVSSPYAVRITSVDKWLKDTPPQSRDNIISLSNAVNIDIPNIVIDTLNIYGRNTEILLGQNANIKNIVNNIDSSWQRRVEKIAGDSHFINNPKAMASVSIYGDGALVSIGNGASNNFDAISYMLLANNSTAKLNGDGGFLGVISGHGNVLVYGNVMFDKPLGQATPINSILIQSNKKATFASEVRAGAILLESKAKLLVDVSANLVSVDAYINPNDNLSGIGDVEIGGVGDVSFKKRLGGGVVASASDYVYSGFDGLTHLANLSVKANGSTKFNDGVHASMINIGDGLNQSVVVFEKEVSSSKIHVKNNSKAIFNSVLDLFNASQGSFFDFMSPLNGTLELGDATLYLNPNSMKALSGAVNLVASNGALGISGNWSYDEKSFRALVRESYYYKLSNNLGIANDSILLVNVGNKLNHNIFTDVAGTGVLVLDGPDSADGLRRYINNSIGLEKASLKGIELRGQSTFHFTDKVYADAMYLKSPEQILIIDNGVGFNGDIISEQQDLRVQFVDSGFFKRIGTQDNKIHYLEFITKEGSKPERNLLGDIFVKEIKFDSANFVTGRDLLLQSHKIEVLGSVFDIGTNTLVVDGEDGGVISLYDSITANITYTPHEHGSILFRNIAMINGSDNARIVLNIDDDVHVPKRDSIIFDLSGVQLNNVQVILDNPKWQYDLATQKVIAKILQDVSFDEYELIKPAKDGSLDESFEIIADVEDVSTQASPNNLVKVEEMQLGFSSPQNILNPLEESKNHTLVSEFIVCNIIQDKSLQDVVSDLSVVNNSDSIDVVSERLLEEIPMIYTDQIEATQAYTLNNQEHQSLPEVVVDNKDNLDSNKSVIPTQEHISLLSASNDAQINRPVEDLLVEYDQLSVQDGAIEDNQMIAVNAFDQEGAVESAILAQSNDVIKEKDVNFAVAKISQVKGVDASRDVENALSVDSNQKHLAQNANIINANPIFQSALNTKSINNIMLKRTYNFIDIDKVVADNYVAAGEVVGASYQVWANGFGGFHADKSQDSSYYKSHFVGGSIGLEVPLSDSKVLGAAFTKLNSNTKHDVYKVESHNYIGSLYLINKINNWIINSGVFLGYGKTKANRIFVDGVANSKFDSYLYGAHGIVAYHFKVGSHDFTPSVALHYSYSRQDSHIENSSMPSKAYFIKEKKSQILTSIGAIKYSKCLNESAKFKVVPSMQLSVSQDLMLKATDAAVRLINQENYMTNNIKPKKQTVVSVVPSVTVKSDALDVQVGYSYDKGRNSYGHTVFVKLISSF